VYRISRLKGSAGGEEASEDARVIDARIKREQRNAHANQVSKIASVRPSTGEKPTDVSPGTGDVFLMRWQIRIAI